MVADKPSPLLAAFYSEFNDIAGPELVYQYPEGFVSAEQFSGVSDYVMSKHETSSVMGINAYGWTIVGYQVQIVHGQYTRNKLLFNAGLIFTQGADTEPYHTALRKIGNTLKHLEIGEGFLSKAESKERLRTLLQELVLGLRNSGRVVLRFNKLLSMGLTLYRKPEVPFEIHDCEVPWWRSAKIGEGLDEIIVSSAASITLELEDDLDQLDLALEQIMPHIDGVKFVKKISMDSKVNLKRVKRALQALLYCGHISLGDIFRYSNVYIRTPKAADLLRSQTFRQSCWELIRKDEFSDVPTSSDYGYSDEQVGWGVDTEDWTRSSWGTNRRFATGNTTYSGDGTRALSPPPRCPEGFALERLYCSFQADRNVAKVLTMNMGVSEVVDHRRMVKFGVESGLIRRVYVYPQCITPDYFRSAQGRAAGGSSSSNLVGTGRADGTSAMITAGGTAPNDLMVKERRKLTETQAMIDGTRSEDFLCVLGMCTPEDLERYVTSDGVSKYYRVLMI